MWGDGPIDLVATTEKGQPAPLWNKFGTGGSVATHGINPETQHKYRESLNSQYELTNGTYLVNARMIFDSKGNHVESGKTKITIVPANPVEAPKTNSPAE